MTELIAIRLHIFHLSTTLRISNVAVLYQSVKSPPTIIG